MRRLLTIFAVILWVPLALQATIPEMKFRRLDTRDGLSNSQVLSIYRDSKGFVWIGTPYGLNRYDGYRVKTYYSELRDTTTLRNNYVDAIYEAFDGKLWLQQGMGYAVLDPVTERCDRHPERWLEEQGVTGGLEFLYIDSKKDFWVKTYNNGFWHFSPQTKKLKHYNFGYGEQDFNSDIGVSSMAEVGNLVVLASHNGEVLCFDRERDIITKKDLYLRQNGLAHDQSCKLRIDHEGNFWVCAQPMVYIWEKKTGQWYHSVQSAFKAWGFDNLPDEMSVWDVAEDSRNRIYLATDHGGLYAADPRDKDLKQFLTSKFDESTISDNTLRNLYLDQLGRLWIGSYMNGVNLFVGNTSSFRNFELGIINTICYDREGYTWLGTNDVGIIRYNNTTKEQVPFTKENCGIGSNIMVGSWAASDGSVWFGTYEGGLIHIKNGQVTNYRATGDTLGLANNNVWTICEDQWNNIWIGTLGGGVQRIDKRTGRMRTFNMANSALSSDYISSISMTKKGWLLVAHSKFLSFINPKTFRVVNFDITNNRDNVPITEMSTMAMEDSRGLIWQASTAGATVWDRKGDHVYLIDMRSGFFGSTVNSFVEDENHSLWVVTDHGVSNVIPQLQDDGRYTFVVRSYNNRDGLQNGPYNQRSICRTKPGIILVGGQGGLDALNPSNMSKGRSKETPVFSGLQLFNRDVSVGEEVDGRVILKESLNECRRLKLRYGDAFTVQLGSSSGEIHNRSRFVYMLEGFNDAWVKTSELNPNISFMSLRYGDYVLRVRMLNDDGTLGEDESVLDITITAPFWRARWALLFYVLAVLAAVWWWRRIFLRRQKERMELTLMSHEMEKQQWYYEMRGKLIEEIKSGKTFEDEVVQPERLAYHPATSELVGFIRQKVKQYKVPGGKLIRVTFKSPLRGLTMSFDAALMSRMMDVLLNNASRFALTGTRIKVTLTATAHEAELRVADRGMGIPEGARARMFEPRTKPNIGLDVIKQIAELHGGSVRAEDNPGGGTVFIILLPVTVSAAKTDDDIPVEEAVVMEENE